MPLYDYTCPEGHRNTLRRAFDQVTTGCPCGLTATRAEVNRINFAFQAKGEKLSHYLEAANTAEYLQTRTDDPALKSAEDVWFPAKRRAEARIFNGEQEWSP